MLMWAGCVSMLSNVTGFFYFQVSGKQTNTLAPCPHGKPEGHPGCEQDQHVSICTAHNELPKHQGEEHQEVWACHGAKENVRGDVHPVPPSAPESWAHLCRPKPVAHGCCSGKIEDGELLYWQPMTDFMVGSDNGHQVLSRWGQGTESRNAVCYSWKFWQGKDEIASGARGCGMVHWFHFPWWLWVWQLMTSCSLYSSSSNYVHAGQIIQ